MLPYYTKQEIIDQVTDRSEELNISRKNLLETFNIDHSILKNGYVWTVEEYEAIAQFLGTTLESLTGIYESEDLNGISFRANENTDEINDHVKKLDDIFTALAYQIKVGGGSSVG